MNGKMLRLALLLVFLAGIGVGCSGGTPTPEELGALEGYQSAYLDTSYPDALPASSQLALGTLLLEGTENAVTPEQAARLLPLWQSLRGGTLQGSAEIRAALTAIERAMTPEQLRAIAAMRLTRQRLQDWMEAQGLRLAPGGTPGMGYSRGTPGAWGNPGGRVGPWGTPPAGWSTPAPEMQTRIAERRATMAAGGMPQRAFGQENAALWQFRALLGPLIQLLTRRAGP